MNDETPHFDPSPTSESPNEASAGHAVDAVLAALRRAEPRPGMEARVLQRLAATPVPERRSWVRRGLLWAAVPVLAACVVVVGLAHRRSAHPGAFPRSAARRTTSPENAAAGDSALPLTVEARSDTSAKTRVQECPHLSIATLTIARDHAATPERTMAALHTADTGDGTGSAHEASFPAPEMPLTEQEQLLLRIVHRNDPVQTAMLDPRERSVALARDRAEVTHFFTPPPLPEDLQREIDAAVRKQYVPPPPTLANETKPDRSLP